MIPEVKTLSELHVVLEEKHEQGRVEKFMFESLNKAHSYNTNHTLHVSHLFVPEDSTRRVKIHSSLYPKDWQMGTLFKLDNLDTCIFLNEMTFDAFTGNVYCLVYHTRSSQKHIIDRRSLHFVECQAMNEHNTCSCPEFFIFGLNSNQLVKFRFGAKAA